MVDEKREVKGRAVDKFATFWKISTLQKPQRRNRQTNDNYMPFQPESERSGLPALRKAGSSGRRDYDALHKMLMILEDKDPTLRLSARSWLQDSKSNYSRIIDPLLKEFMSNN